MGLDSVEIVLDLENEFGIDIPDADAEQLYTVRSCVRYIAARKGIATTVTCATAHAFYRLRRTIMDRNPISRQRIRLSTNLIDLVPVPRQTALRQTLVDLGLPRLPQPRPSAIRLKLAIALASVGFGIAVAIASVPMIPIAVPLPLQVVGAIAVIAGAAVAAPALYREIRSPISTHLTVRDVVLALAPQELASIESTQHQLDDISHRVRQVVAGVMGINMEDVSEASHFVRDLEVD